MNCFCCRVQVYPGLMVTSGFLHYILNSINMTIHIRDVCVFLAPIFRSVANPYGSGYLPLCDQFQKGVDIPLSVQFHFVLRLWIYLSLHACMHVHTILIIVPCPRSSSGLTAIAAYLFTQEIWNQGAGLLAACFIAIGKSGVSVMAEQSANNTFSSPSAMVFQRMQKYKIQALGGCLISSRNV